MLRKLVPLRTRLRGLLALMLVVAAAWFIALPRTARADAVSQVTGWLFPNAYADGGGYDQPSNVLRRDGLVAHTDVCCGLLTVQNFDPVALPAGSSISQIDIRFHLAGIDTTVRFQQDIGYLFDCPDHNHPGYVKDFTPTSETVLDDYIVTYTDQDCAIQPNLVRTGNYDIQMVRYNGSYANYTIDDISVRFTYTSPPGSVLVTPQSGLVGTTFTASYACDMTPIVSITQANGQPAQGAVIGIPVSGDQVNYTQGIQLNSAGSFVIHLACDGQDIVSPTLTVTDPGAYVALGDSYSSGEGVLPFFEPNNACHRSTAAYSTLVNVPSTNATYFSLRGKTYQDWGFLACSGATTGDVSTIQLGSTVDSSNMNYLPLTDRTSLVTITVGGDDLEFAKVLTFCAVDHLDCANEPYGGAKTLTQWFGNHLKALKPKLVALYRKIHTDAKNARLLVLGYPQLFPATPDEQNCAQLRQYTYYAQLGNKQRVASLLYSQDEQNFLRSADSQVNQAIQDSVKAAGFGEFVGVADAFAGHEVCGNLGAWINGISLTPTNKFPYFKAKGQAFHPTAVGQAEYAQVVNTYLAQH